MSRPGDFAPLKGAREIAATLPASAFADTPLAEAVTLERALSLLLSHGALQNEADRLRSALAELCALPEGSAVLEHALAPGITPEDGLKSLADGLRRRSERTDACHLLEEDGA